jgi:hypothetical protein
VLQLAISQRWGVTDELQRGDPAATVHEVVQLPQ